MEYRVFGDRIRLSRLGLGLSQRQLAERLGVSRSSVGMYESGAREPSLETTQRVASILGVSIDYLFGCTDDPRSIASTRSDEGQCPVSIAILEHLDKMSLEEQEEVLRFVKFRLAERERGL